MRFRVIFLIVCSVGLTACQRVEERSVETSPPNFVIIFADDLGYGDLDIFGHSTIRTPRLDRMAEEGQKWTQFYVGAPLCTPSRAALLTGRLPIRSGMCSDKRGVLFPDSGGGLPADEITLAEALKEKDYATACIGKWHLGHHRQFLPTQNGFDYYFGIPYSNDMDRTDDSPKGMAAFLDPKIEYWNVPLMRNEEIIERPANQNTITKRYTEEACSFIREHADQPFFVYLAHNMPHVPLFASREFDETSLRGLYGDVVQEIDWSVGQVLDTLKQANLDRKTLVLFTSDNGPWLTYDQQGGSAGLLRGGKGSTWEGGMREPTIFWGPGLVKPGVVMDLGATMDVLPTFLRLAGIDAPSDHVLDGFDLSATLRDGSPSPRETVFYYRGTEIYAVRQGAFKAHFTTKSGFGSDAAVVHDPPLLYQLDHDPSEKYDVAGEHLDVIQRIRRVAEEQRKSVEPVPDQLAIQ